MSLSEKELKEFASVVIQPFPSQKCSQITVIWKLSLDFFESRLSLTLSNFAVSLTRLITKLAWPSNTCNVCNTDRCDLRPCDVARVLKSSFGRKGSFNNKNPFMAFLIVRNQVWEPLAYKSIGISPSCKHPPLMTEMDLTGIHLDLCGFLPI